MHAQLVEAGHGDVALMVAQIKTAPSYVYMVEQGATTLWETWFSTRYVPGGSIKRPHGSNGVPSWNHIMYGGGTSEFYFKHLAGIQQDPTSHGWERIVLKPAVWIPAQNTSICANLSSAKASLVTSRGLLVRRVKENKLEDPIMCPKDFITDIIGIRVKRYEPKPAEASKQTCI